MSSDCSLGGDVVDSVIPTWGDGQLVRGHTALRQPVVLHGVGNVNLGSLSGVGGPPGGQRTCNPQAGHKGGRVGSTKPCLERGTGGKLACDMQSPGGLWG